MDALLRRRAMIVAGVGPTPPAPLPGQVEYLEITNAYFDTGIRATQNLDFELDIELVSTGGGACLFGARNRSMSASQTNLVKGLSAYADDGGYLKMEDYNYDSGYLTAKPSILNTRCLVKITGRKLFVDTTEYVASGITQTYSYNTTVGLLRQHGLSDSWPSGAQAAITAKVYGFKIWKASELVCELVPKKDGSNVGCLYDKVAQSDIYAVAGTVTPGPDINNL